MRRLIPLAVAFALALPTVPAAAGVAAPSTASVGATAAAIAAPGRLLPAAAKPAATVAGASALQKTGKVRLAVTSNAAKVAVKYRTAKNKKRTATIKIKKGKGAKTLAKGSRSIQVQAKATKKLAKSPWVSIGGEAVVPNVGAGSYTIGPDSAVLPPMSKYSTLNQYTRHYYLIRSYLERFEAAGGGHLVLRPGRYEISSTLYVPSNVTIQLSAGTTLVKSNQTGTSKFSPSNSMFMLIRPALGKVSGAVGGHDGDRNITIAGAGGGQSVIDMADIYDTLAIIAGHNRNVTISGITFKRMNNNHFIELDACADCTISGNEFLDAAGGTRETAEAINLDTPDPNTHGFSSVWSNQDATPNERVTIEGNRFDGLQRAFGTHNFSAGRYHTDIVVRGNTLTNMRNDGIQIMNWRNAVFTGNAISAGSGHSGINTCGTKTPTITGNFLDRDVLDGRNRDLLTVRDRLVARLGRAHGVPSVVTSTMETTVGITVGLHAADALIGDLLLIAGCQVGGHRVGGQPPRRPPKAFSTTSARSRVRVKGCSARRRRMAVATRPDWRSSPYSLKMWARGP